MAPKMHPAAASSDFDSLDSDAVSEQGSSRSLSLGQRVASVEKMLLAERPVHLVWGGIDEVESSSSANAGEQNDVTESDHLHPSSGARRMAEFITHMTHEKSADPADSSVDTADPWQQLQKALNFTTDEVASLQDKEGLNDRGLHISLGSKRHDENKCKPCLFVSTPPGCDNGISCEFCHIPQHQGKEKSRPCKTKRDRYKKLLKRMDAAQNPEESNSKPSQSSTSPLPHKVSL
ncbi:unnamed protein product [Polarella glacialis]|uniref:C3H1-type domain-containing protein n=1 Tax=Polarella glacialis TaxID=89957 RepID=A0A813IL35_POLGL|nr:unnamed protein product [Polarella glacialis]CAE8651954.1 unnamed protein product [Polarella glacialis]